MEENTHFKKWVSEKINKERINENQYGHVAGLSCVDNQFTLQQLIDKIIVIGEENHSVYWSRENV